MYTSIKLRFATPIVFFLLLGCKTSLHMPVPMAPTPAIGNTPNGTLPRNAIPLHYDLALEILPEKEHFRGTVAITVSLKEKADHLWIHGKNLHIKDARISLANGHRQSISYQQVTDQGLCKISFNTEVEPQELTLYFQYHLLVAADMNDGNSLLPSF